MKNSKQRKVLPFSYQFGDLFLTLLVKSNAVIRKRTTTTTTRRRRSNITIMVLLLIRPLELEKLLFWFIKLMLLIDSLSILIYFVICT